VERCGDAVARLVSVDPHTRPLEHGDELRAVAAARGVEELPEGGGFVAVVGATGCLTRLREEAKPDAQRCPESSTLVRAVGSASRRAGSIGSPVTSSTP
jgi:hypothetical protein